MLQKQFVLHEVVILSFASNFFAFVKLHYVDKDVSYLGNELLFNFGTKFQRLHYYMKNFCNLIGLQQ